jgi:hypothetical protein
MGLTPSAGGPPSRRARERRAYQLVLVGSTAGVIAIAGLLLAVFGVMGFAIPVVAAIVAILCLVLFRRTIGGA